MCFHAAAFHRVHALTLLLLPLLLLRSSFLLNLFQAPINPFLLATVGPLLRTLVKIRQAQSRGGATEEGKSTREREREGLEGRRRR